MTTINIINMITMTERHLPYGIT